MGEHLKYLIWAQGRPIACMAWSSAPRHLGSRDRYIGWSQEARQRNIRFIAYNTRFLILPWVTAPHLASHILSRVTASLSRGTGLPRARWSSGGPAVSHAGAAPTMFPRGPREMPRQSSSGD